MSAHKSDEYMPNCELYYHHKTISVAAYVENIMLVTYVVCSGEVYLYV